MRLVGYTKIILAFIPLALFPDIARSDTLDLSDTQYGEHLEGRGLDFAIRPGNRQAISYYHVSKRDLYYAEFNGSEWVTTVVDESLTTSPIIDVDDTLRAATRTSLTFLHNNTHIVYFDADNNRVMHAYRLFDTWTTEAIDDSEDSSAGVSVVTCGSELCVSYYDKTNQDLRFARGLPGSWSKETVDSSTRDLGYYYAKKSPGQDWELFTPTTWTGVGGRTGIVLNENSEPIIAFRRQRYSAIFGSSTGSYVGQYMRNGVFATTSAGMYGFYYSYDYELQKRHLGRSRARLSL